MTSSLNLSLERGTDKRKKLKTRLFKCLLYAYQTALPNTQYRYNSCRPHSLIKLNC